VLNARGVDQFAVELSFTVVLALIKPHRSITMGQACGAIVLYGHKTPVGQLQMKEKPPLSFCCVNPKKPPALSRHLKLYILRN
jgi:hypothetical protein